MVTYIVVSVLAGFLLGLALWRAERVWLTLHGMHIVRCPENQQPAAVHLASWRTALAFGKGLPSVRNCSRWPARRTCDQACVKEVRGAPRATLVESILTNWCHYNRCVCCGAPLARLRVGPHQPHLIDRQLKIFEWKEIPPQELPQTLRQAEPVCETCVVAETHTW